MDQESNRYALASIGNDISSSYVLITRGKMQKFVCALIYMRICKLPSFELYWSKKDNVFNQLFISNLLKYVRFCEIKKYFYVFDKDEFESVSPSPGSTTKLDGLITYFNKKISFGLCT